MRPITLRSQNIALSKLLCRSGSSAASAQAPPQAKPQHSSLETPNSRSETPKPAELLLEVKTRKKTITELDEELKWKLEGRSGEGGAAGLEYEDGKASAMKRGVRDNMFRLI